MKLRMGTRGSELALAQSLAVARRLEGYHPGLTVEAVVIKTTGDQRVDAPLSSLGGKGAFTREIESALLLGEVDFAVHSLKDLPTRLPQGLCLACTPERESPWDVLIAGTGLDGLKPGARIGTGSLRRVSQLRQARPDLEFQGVRGNLPTRVRKWREGGYDGVVLARAGLNRLGLAACGLREPELHELSPDQCLPAPCQGVLGIEARQDDSQTLRLLQVLHHPVTHAARLAERAFLEELGGDCSLPAGCLARLESGLIQLVGVLGDPSGGRLQRAAREDPADQAERAGRKLACSLREAVAAWAG